jgi:hypothetical protein
VASSSATGVPSISDALPYFPLRSCFAFLRPQKTPPAATAARRRIPSPTPNPTAIALNPRCVDGIEFALVAVGLAVIVLVGGTSEDVRELGDRLEVLVDVDDNVDKVRSFKGASVNIFDGSLQQLYAVSKLQQNVMAADPSPAVQFVKVLCACAQSES